MEGDSPETRAAHGGAAHLWEALLCYKLKLQLKNNSDLVLYPAPKKLINILVVKTG